MDMHLGVAPAALRTFGALQRSLAQLKQRLADDGTLRREQWLAAASDEHERALRARAWAEHQGQQPAAA